MDFGDVKTVTISEGVVSRILRGGVVLWDAHPKLDAPSVELMSDTYTLAITDEDGNSETFAIYADGVKKAEIEKEEGAVATLYDLTNLSITEGTTHQITVIAIAPGKQPSDPSNAVTYYAGWDYPQQSGDELRVTQAYAAAKSGDELSLT